MVICRAYSVEDRDGCLALLRRGHAPDFSADRFAWLHENGPAGPSHKVVCESDGQIIGLYAVLRREASLDGQPISVGRDVDPVVDIHWRSKGLFSRMLNWMLENINGIDLFYNFANRAAAPGFIKNGWTIGEYAYDQVAQFSFQRLASTEGLLWAATRLARPPLGHWPVRELAVDEVHSLPMSPMPPHRRFAVLRTTPYLSWRYLASPIRKYRFLARHDGAELIDIMVVHGEPIVRRAHVIDLVVYRADGGNCAAYLPFLHRELDSRWVSVWSTVPAIWRRGFLRSPRANAVQVLARPAPGKECMAAGLKPGDFFLTPGDLEIS